MELKHFVQDFGPALWVSSMGLIGLKVARKKNNDPIDLFTSVFFFGSFGFMSIPIWQYGLSYTSTFYVLHKLYFN